MFRYPKHFIFIFLILVFGYAQSSEGFPGVGRNATDKEVKAWDIDVRPDFKGLPVGSGSVSRGQNVWESKCSSCHGIFGESGEVFNPIVGGVSSQDIKNGQVANLQRSDYPSRTTMMKVATISTLWDYINRAMPWTAPKTLTTEEVYAVTAFLLNLSGVVEDDFTLSNKNIAAVQERMPNRNGMTTQHQLWPGTELSGSSKPDTSNTACMKDCSHEPKLTSFLPDFARNAHGNLAEQNRLIGAQHGINTAPKNVKVNPPSIVTPTPKSPITEQKPIKSEIKIDSKAVLDLLKQNQCLSCHAIDKKILGPSFKSISEKYPGQIDYLTKKIRSGGGGIWGPIPMPPQSLAEEKAKLISTWLSLGAPL